MTNEDYQGKRFPLQEASVFLGDLSITLISPEGGIAGLAEITDGFRLHA
jgi:hypothetical protein